MTSDQQTVSGRFQQLSELELSTHKRRSAFRVMSGGFPGLICC
jgi:hypothetical protein